jgi:hypothetical protein
MSGIGDEMKDCTLERDMKAFRAICEALDPLPEEAQRRIIKAVAILCDLPVLP